MLELLNRFLWNFNKFILLYAIWVTHFVFTVSERRLVRRPAEGGGPWRQQHVALSYGHLNKNNHYVILAHTKIIHYNRNIITLHNKGKIYFGSFYYYKYS